MLFIIIGESEKRENSDRRELRPTTTSTPTLLLNTYIYSHTKPHLNTYSTILYTIRNTYNNTINRLDFRLCSSLSTDSFLDAEQTIDFISVLGSIVFIQFTNLGTDVASVIFIIPIVV